MNLAPTESYYPKIDQREVSSKLQPTDAQQMVKIDALKQVEATQEKKLSAVE